MMLFSFELNPLKDWDNYLENVAFVAMILISFTKCKLSMQSPAAQMKDFDGTEAREGISHGFLGSS